MSLTHSVKVAFVIPSQKFEVERWLMEIPRKGETIFLAEVNGPLKVKKVTHHISPTSDILEPYDEQVITIELGAPTS